MKLAVIYATLGRPDLVAGALEFMLAQTRTPDQVVISAINPADVPEFPAGLPVEAVYGPKGLPAQRNTGLRKVRECAQPADVVIFFDDDFAPGPDFLAVVEAMMQADPGLGGLTGNVVADGIGGPGYTFDDARRFLANAPPVPLAAARKRSVPSLYGCNMAIRMSMAEGLAFDETLPLYAWQEDVDYTVQLARRGRLLWTNALAGVHLGAKRSRMPGLTMGYAQIANPIFLRRKRTMAARHAYPLMARNLAMNLMKSIRPEPWCDRRGRLVGNIRALRDFFDRRLHPGNILDMK